MWQFSGPSPIEWNRPCFDLRECRPSRDNEGVPPSDGGSSLLDAPAQYPQKPISLGPGHYQRRRKHRLVAYRADNQPPITTSLKHPFSHAHIGIEGRLALIVRHVLDTNHEMTTPNISDHRQIPQCERLLVKIRSDIANPVANPLALNDLNILQRGSTRYRVTRVGESHRQRPTLTIRLADDVVDFLGENRRAQGEHSPS